MENLNPNEIAETIERLATKATDKIADRTYKRGVVNTVTGQKASVYIEGNLVATPGIPSLGTYAPRTGDKVLILSIGRSGANPVILGPINTNINVWITPTMQNGWTNYDTNYSLPRYYKDASGHVQLKGMIKNGTMTTAAFTLPAGFRPLERLLMPSVSNNAIGRVDILPTGQVQPQAGINAWITLDGIRFKAEQ